MGLEQFLVACTRSKRFDFAKKYKLKIKTVVRPENEKENFLVSDQAYPGPGIIINSDF